MTTPRSPIGVVLRRFDATPKTMTAVVRVRKGKYSRLRSGSVRSIHALIKKCGVSISKYLWLNMITGILLVVIWIILISKFEIKHIYVGTFLPLWVFVYITSKLLNTTLCGLVIKLSAWIFREWKSIFFKYAASNLQNTMQINCSVWRRWNKISHILGKFMTLEIINST